MKIRPLPALRGILPALMLLCLPLLPASGADAQPPRPNILLILADDLGFSDVGCFGAEIATPNLDKIASEGVRFTQFYNAARCCPTRASLLTGLYPHEAGMGLMAGGGRGMPGYEGHLTDRCVTIPEVLKPAGYRCYMVGKWHLAAHPNPIARGFDEFYGMIGGFNTCWQEHPSYTRLPADHPRREYAPDKFYSTDVFGDYALDFISDARKTPGKPWFLYLAFNAAHFPLHAPEAEIAKYEKTYTQGWDKIREERFARQQQLGLLPKDTELTPRSFIPANWANKQTGWADKTNPAWDSLSADRRADLARRMAVYAAMIDRMDQNIGRVLADLRSHGELDNTLVIFLSDNGACAEWDPNGFDGSSGPHNILHTGDELKKIGGPESYVSYGSGWANACNTPWRLYKHYDYEGGIAAPCIVRWPAVVKRPGGFNTTPSDIIDFMPTILEVTGASYPKSFQDHAILPMEGRSLLPILKDEPAANRPIFFEHEGNRAARDGQWKLVALDNDPWELYDFNHDRSELHNLASQRPEIVARLAKEWDEWATRSFVRQPNSLVSTNSTASTIPNPQVANKALTISCDATPESSNGVILAQGGRQQGYALWLREGKLVFTVRVNGEATSIEANNIPTGHMAVTARLNRDASMELDIDGKSTAKGKAPGLIPVQPKDALSIGQDDKTPVGEYESPNRLRGKVENVRVVAD
jgi:arylsulfatase